MSRMTQNFSFMSTYPHSLDEKGRLALPGKLREELRKSERPDEMVALPSEDGYVTLYPHEQWEKIEADIRAIEDGDERDEVLEYYQGNAERISLDKNGRLLLPPRQREIAGLEREVDVLGLSFKIKVRPRLAAAGAEGLPKPKKPESAIVKKLSL